MDVRLLAAVSGELDGLNVAALCREHGISRKTFYKWRARYVAAGLDGLEPRSRRPARSPTRFADRGPARDGAQRPLRAHSGRGGRPAGRRAPDLREPD